MHRWASFVLLTIAVSAVSGQNPAPVPARPGPGPGMPVEAPGRPPPPRVPKHMAPVPAGPLKFDRFGDPLPSGAIARFGSARLRHGNKPSALDFTPDGKHLASLAGSESSLRLWDPKTGKEVARLTVSVVAAAFTHDGSVVVVDDDAKGRVWHPATGTLRALPSDALPAASTVLAVHPDGRTFAVCGAQAVAVIDTITGKTKAELKSPEGQTPTRLVYSPDGRWLAATGGQKSGVWLWDLRTMKRVRSYRSESDSVEFAFSPDGAKLVITSEVMRLYSTDAEEADEAFTPPEMQQIQCARFSTDGKAVFAVNQDGGVLRFDVATGEVKDTWEAPDAAFRQPFALAADAALVAGTDDHGAIRVWNPKTGAEPEVERLSPLAEPWLAADGKAAAVLDEACRIHTWDPTTGKPIKVAELPVDESVVVTWDPRSGRAAAFLGSEETEVHFIDVASGKVISKVGTGSGRGRHVAFCPSDPARAAVFAPGTATVVHVPSGRTLRAMTLSEAGGPTRGPFSPDGRVLAVTTKPLSVWEVATGKKRFEVDAAEDPQGVTFSRDGRTLAAWDSADSVVIVDVRSGAVIRRMQHPTPDGSVNAAAFAPDGRRLATGGRDGVVSVWDVGTGEVTLTLRGHETTVNGLVFSRDGARLLSASSDGTALLWDMTLPPRPRAAEVPLGSDDALKRLGDADPAAAQRGMTYFYQHPDEAVKLLGAKVTARAGLSPERVAQLVADLDSNAFRTREAAAKELEAAGPVASAALRAAAEKAASAEVRKTAADLLARVDGVPTNPDDLRAIRAVEVMETIGTVGAREVLARWAAGPAGAWLTTEAVSAVARLNPPHER